MTQAPSCSGNAREINPAHDRECAPPAAIDNLSAEIQVMIVGWLTAARDLLALRATSRTWRLLMTGDRGPVRALCRGLLPDEAVDRLETYHNADSLACIIYGTLGAARTSLRSITPIKRNWTTYWVSRARGGFCGWGLSMGETRIYGRRPLRTWSIGRWSNGILVDGVARATDIVRDVRGNAWHRCPSSVDSGCGRCTMRHALWTGRVFGGVAHGHGVWKALNCHCVWPSAQYRSRCAGYWYKGALVRGTMTWADDYVYDGEFKDDFFDGLGALCTGRGMHYMGHWSKGRPHGNGELHDDNSHGSYLDSGSSIYIGEWDGGAQDGTGTIEWADGRRYDGEWYDGQPDGHGSFIYADGSQHDGTWHLGMRHGHGKSFEPDGRLHRRGYWSYGSPCSRLAFRHMQGMGRQKSVPQYALAGVARSFRVVCEWFDKPLSF